MSNSTQGSNKSKSSKVIISVLVSIIVAIIALAYKLSDQKDEILKETRANYESRISDLNERYKEKIEDLKAELSDTKQDLRAANNKYEASKELYDNALARATQLEEFLKDAKSSEGKNADSMIVFSKLKGEVKQYQSAYEAAKLRITSLETTVQSLESDLSAAQSQIVQLRDSLAISETQLQQMKEMVANQKETNDKNIDNLIQAHLQEKNGDALPDRRRFIDEKYDFYQNARLFLMEVSKGNENSYLLNESIKRVYDKMEALKPGAPEHNKPMRAF